MTSHPKDLTDDVIETIAREDKIEKYIHLPAQSGNNRILKLMNRNYTREKYLSIIEKIREKIPNCRITSDFIVGFPSETDEEFEDTYNLVKQVRFDSIFAFMYSPREGTVASKMEEQIDEEIKHERVNKLLNLEKLIQKEDNKS
jgi:tRNA-2-methylthio-N6-dimethylallyladenosine synthase